MMLRFVVYILLGNVLSHAYVLNKNLLRLPSKAKQSVHIVGKQCSSTPLKSTIQSTAADPSNSKLSKVFKIINDEHKIWRIMIWDAPSASILCGLTTAVIVQLAKRAIFAMDGLRSKYSIAAPLLGSLVVSILYIFRHDLSVGPTSIYAEDDNKFSLNRQITRLVAAIIAVGSGCGLALAAPAAEVGMTVGRMYSRLFKLDQRFTRHLCMAGAAAGFAANFNAPLAGFAYAIEVANRQLANRPDSNNVKQPVTVNTSFLFFAALFSALAHRSGPFAMRSFSLAGIDFLAKDPTLYARLASQAPVFLFIGMMCGVVSSLFHTFKAIFEELFRPISFALRPILGGAVAASAAASGAPQSILGGYSTLSNIVSGSMSSPMCLFKHLSSKILVLSCAQGSGLVGGIIAPSLFAGASLGVLSQILATKVMTPFGLNPANPISSSVYAVAGAAGLMAGFTRAPMTAALLAIELTKDLDVALPVLMVTAVANWWARR